MESRGSGLTFFVLGSLVSVAAIPRPSGQLGRAPWTVRLLTEVLVGKGVPSCGGGAAPSDWSLGWAGAMGAFLQAFLCIASAAFAVVLDSKPHPRLQVGLPGGQGRQQR